MIEKRVIESCFNEEETAQDILFLKNERRKTLKRHVENKTYAYYYILIVNYLLKHKYSISDIKKIVRRHITLVAYLIIHEKVPDSFEYNHEYFNNLLYGKGLSKKDLLMEVDDIYEYGFTDFYELYFAKEGNYDTIKKSIASIVNSYEEITGKDNLASLMNNIMDYFYYGCKFADLKYYNHSDLIISYNMNNEGLSHFKFEGIEGVDIIYKENWISTQSFKEKDVKEKILGHIINIIMDNNNLDLKKEMKIKPIHYYEIMMNEARKKFINDTFNFFDVDTKALTATINVSKINNSFKFKYNNKKYAFEKDGIKKI